MRLSKFGPRGVRAIIPSKSRFRKLSSDAVSIFRTPDGKFVIFTMKPYGAGGGADGNDYGISLYRVNETGRVAVRVVDSLGSVIATVIDLGGYAGLATAISNDATLSPLLTMRLSQAIPNSQAFSSSLTSYTYFIGGS